MTRMLFAVILLAFVALPVCTADESSPARDVAHGHSAYGAVFNEGPRQAAYLMGGTGTVHFPITASDRKAQQFFDQGVGQLHGFWYFEAERSFRQAAQLDPDCAMAYWGMAMANFDHRDRAKGFIARAVEKRAHAGVHEQRYIDALAAFQNSRNANGHAPEPATRAYAQALEQIFRDYPDDIEARAFLVCARFWHFRNVGKDTEKLDEVLDTVFQANPLHPAHHYRIHLWDRQDNQRALPSVAVCGRTAPAIAHQWHMSAHIYSGLQRYADAAWEQEAAARVDHAHMMRDRVLPDQIHNYAHNQEWLIRNLAHIGRCTDAVALAKNLIELPRHPRSYAPQREDTIASVGRQRLLEVLCSYERWDDLIALAGSAYLEPTAVPGDQVRLLRALGVAHGEQGDADRLRQTIAELTTRLENERRVAAQPRAGHELLPAPREVPAAVVVMEATGYAAEVDGLPADLLPPPRAAPPAPKAPPGRQTDIEDALHELRGYAALMAGDRSRALASFQQAKGMDRVRLARVLCRAGEQTGAEALAHQAAADRNDVLPLANLVDILERCGKKDEAAKAFDRLRAVGGQIDRLDLPPFDRLRPVADRLQLAFDWRGPVSFGADRGERPVLDSLGPLRWQPTAAPAWTLPGPSGKDITLADYQGRPVVVIFYLGHGCLHCVEQLNQFAPLTEAFRAAGIQIVAICTDTLDDLVKSHQKYKSGGTFPFPIAADPRLDVFKAYRCHDDFERKPLHGTFFIDAAGLVRWQDIGAEPFNQPAFLLQEAKRLLRLPAR